jgi:S-formylglutathione hydrolase FrmB
LGFGHRPPDGEDARAAEFRRIVGADPAGSAHDLHALAARCVEAGNLPRLLIDCGTEDFLIDSNREFVRHLGALGAEHEYREFPGTHDWDYWDVHVREALAFHMGTEA